MEAIGVLIGIALAHLRVRVRQTVVASLGVAVGVGLFLATSGMMVGSQNDFTRTLVETAPHIIVRDEQRSPSVQPAQMRWTGGAVSVEGVAPQPELRGLKNWPAMLDDIRALPGAIAAPSLSGAATLRFAGRTEAVLINGIDPRIEGRLTEIAATLTNGSLEDLERRPDGVIISRPIADRLGARAGDTLIVTSAAGVIQRMRILALIEPDALSGFYAGDQASYALLRTSQVLFARPGVVNQLHIKLGGANDAQAVAGRLEAVWGYTWESWQERSKDLLGLIVVRTIVTYAVVSAILLVASFGIYTAISTSVTEKRRDIAILRAMGFTEADVQGIFLFEGLAVGLAGTAAGFLIGTGLLEALAAAPISLNGRPYHLPLARGLDQYAIAGTVALAAALVAAWLPARKAAEVDPVVILRGAA